MKTTIRTAQAGIPKGGTTAQVLTKNSNTDYDVSWGTGGGGGGGITSINGDTTAVQTLTDAAGGYINVVDNGTGGHTLGVNIAGLATDPTFISDLTGDSTFQTSVNNFVSGVSGKIAINTTTETVTATTGTLYTVAIPGGTLGTNDAVLFRVLASSVNLSGASASVTINVLYGGTQIATGQLSLGSSGGTLNTAGYIEGIITASGATNAQKGAVWMGNVSIGGSNSGTYSWDSGYGTASVDSTTNQNLVIQAVGSSFSGTGAITAQAIIVSKV